MAQRSWLTSRAGETQQWCFTWRSCPSLLSHARDIFKEPEDDDHSVPVPMDEGAGGAGLMHLERAVQGDEAESGEEELEGVRLSTQTQLKEFRELCKKLGLPTSGVRPRSSRGFVHTTRSWRSRCLQR